VATLLRERDVTLLVRGLMRPFSALGIDTSGPELALSTALALVPRLGARLEAPEDERLRPWSRSFWTDELPRLAAELYAQADELAKSEQR